MADAWYQRPLSVTLIGIITAAAITGAGASVKNAIDTARMAEKQDARISTLELRTAAGDAAMGTLTVKSIDHGERIVGVETSLRNIEATLRRVETKLDNLPLRFGSIGR